jgi:type IV pilus biogenesis/stability protein PilW
MMRWLSTLLSLMLAAGCAGISDKAKKNATVAATFQEIGARELSLGMPEAAIRDLLRALAADDTNPATFHYLGLAYLQLQQYGEAEQSLTMALKLAPEDGEIHNSVGTLYSMLRQWPQAEAAFQRALQCPDYRTPEIAHYNLGRVQAEQGNTSAAIAALGQAETANPGYLPPYLEMARLHEAQGDLGAADEVLQRALTRFPDNVSILFARGKLLYRQQRYERALAVLGDARRLATDDVLRAEIQRYIDILE